MYIVLWTLDKGNSAVCLFVVGVAMGVAKYLLHS